MKDMPWDHGLRVTAKADGLVGHAGAVLLLKLADQAGLTPALARAGKFPLVDRGVAVVNMAVAIVLGATSMNDITLLAHHAPVLGAGHVGRVIPPVEARNTVRMVRKRHP